MNKFKIELVEPEVLNGKEITEIEFREPLGSDLEDIVGVEKLGKAITELAAKLVTNIPLTAEDIRNFKGKNYMKISEGIMGFLA
jgi:hypothetical protein